jgi:predicted TPR repeat methyltransferase
MGGRRLSKALDEVYAAKSEAELVAAYESWATDYDRQTAAAGYCLPFIITGFVARYVPRGHGPILDAGCGTGLSGPYLNALGYSEIEGLDFSEEMLAVARQRDAYALLIRATLGGPLPWTTGHFAAFFSTGVFTEGHAPAASFDELVRITRPGGHAIFTVRDLVLESGGFRRKFTELEEAKRWRLMEESPPLRVFVVDEPDILVKAFVFKVR